MSFSSNSDSESARELLIVYATETGNACDAADFIARQCRKIAFQCRVMNVETISLVRAFIITLVRLLTNHGIARFTLRKYCALRSLNNWFWCGAQGYDFVMESLAAF